MIDDSLTIIPWAKDESCTDAFSAFVSKQIDQSPEEPQKFVMNYRDLWRIPKLNHCVLGYSMETLHQFSLIIHDLDSDEIAYQFDCESSYDVDNDTFSPYSDEQRKAITTNYETIMADFAKHLE